MCSLVGVSEILSQLVTIIRHQIGLVKMSLCCPANGLRFIRTSCDALVLAILTWHDGGSSPSASVWRCTFTVNSLTLTLNSI